MLAQRFSCDCFSLANSVWSSPRPLDPCVVFFAVPGLTKKKKALHVQAKVTEPFWIAGVGLQRGWYLVGGIAWAYLVPASAD